MTLRELKEKLNMISDEKVLNMDVVLQVNNTFAEDMIMDYISDEDSEEFSEEFYELLYQFSQCKLTDIFIKEDLFSKNKENNVYLIADMNHID